MNSASHTHSHFFSQTVVPFSASAEEDRFTHIKQFGESPQVSELARSLSIRPKDRPSVRPFFRRPLALLSPWLGLRNESSLSCGSGLLPLPRPPHTACTLSFLQQQSLSDFSSSPLRRQPFPPQNPWTLSQSRTVILSRCPRRPRQEWEESESAAGARQLRKVGERAPEKGFLPTLSPLHFARAHSSPFLSFERSTVQTSSLY